MVQKDLLIVYNTFGGEKNIYENYIVGLNSIFWHIDKNNLHDRVRVVMSSCLNQNETIDEIKKEYGDKLKIIKYDYQWPVQVTANKSMILSANEFIEKYEGFFYISSGVVLPEIDDLFPRIIEKNNTGEYGLIQLQIPDNQDGGMPCLRERFTQEWFPNQHLDRNVDFLIGVGDYCNFHIGIFNRRLMEFYDKPIVDVYGICGMESGLSYTTYALRLKNIILNDSMCSHIPSSDRSLPENHGFKKEQLCNIPCGLNWGRTNDIFLNDVEGIDAGLGNYPGPYFGSPKVVLQHRKDKYDENFLSTDDRLKYSIKRCYFTNNDELNYETINYVII